MENAQIHQFVEWARSMGHAFHDDRQLEYAARAYFNNDPRLVDEAMNTYARHTLGSVATENLIYRDGPFTWRVDELILDVVQGGDPLMNWIPTATFEYKEESVAHLSWIAPTDFQPATDNYAEYVDRYDNQTDTCDPSCLSFDWGSFEYVMHYGKACVVSPVLKMEDFGMKQHVKTPVPRVRGPQQGMNLSSDAEWALARTGIGLEGHMNWVLMNGVYGGNHQWDGLRAMLTPGYIDSHVVGGGAPIWANPLVYDGTGLSTCEQIVAAIKGLVRRIRWRLMQRNWSVAPGDMAVVLPYAFWVYIKECIACGAMNGCGTDATFTNADIRAELARLENGGVGYGIMEVDGKPIAVIPTSYNSVDGIDGDDNFVTTGDIMVLTRRVNGLNCLEQQYLNFNSALSGWQEASLNSWTSNGGIFRHMWYSQNDLCFQYATHVWGRNILRMAPLQALLTSVTVQTLTEGESENGHFWSPGYYATQDGSTLIPS